MIQRDTYDLVDEPTGVVFGKLLRWAIIVANQLGLVVHSNRVKLGPEAFVLLEKLEPYLIVTRSVNEWPGTRLIGERRALLRLYRLTPDCIDIFVNTANRLYCWVNPDLPEDPHLLREDGSVVLGSVTQEADAWMELSRDEYESLIRDVPWMDSALHQRL